MSLGLIILTVVLGIIFLFLVYLLFMPIRFRLDVSFDKKVTATPAVAIYPFEHRFIRRKAKKPEKPPKPPKEEKPKPEKKKLDFSQLGVADAPILAKVISEALNFVGRIIKAPHYSLKADFAGGASEPDLTGEIYGAYLALRFALPESVLVRYRPDFTAERISGTVELGLAVRIIKLIKETLVFIFRLPIIKLIKLYRKLRKGGRHGKQTSGAGVIDHHANQGNSGLRYGYR